MGRNTIFFLFFGVFIASSANCKEEGPFGVNMGASAATYPSCTPSVTPGWYECNQLPHTHPSFERYQIEATAKTGVCSVLAMGKTIDNDRYGIALKHEAASIAQQISERYGPYDQIDDELLPGSIWNEPQDWMTGLKKNERTFAYLWNQNSSRPTHISSISIVAFGSSEDSGFITVHFNFQNTDACRQTVAADAAQAFGAAARTTKSGLPERDYKKAVRRALADFLAAYRSGGVTEVRIKMSDCYRKTSGDHLPYCLALDTAGELTLPMIEQQSHFPPTEEYRSEVFDRRVRHNLSKHGISKYGDQNRVISEISAAVAAEMKKEVPDSRAN